ncbi:MAG: hypothetical protein WBP79_16220 [Candidatus Acidiferrales bacterium]
MTKQAATSTLLAILCCYCLGAAPPKSAASVNAVQDYFPPSQLIDFAASPDGRWITAYAADGTLLLWETATGHRRDLISHTEVSLYGLAFTPNSSSLLVGDANGLIQLLEIPSGNVLRKMQDRKWVEQFAFSADGSRLASLHDEGITIWDMKTGTELRHVPEKARFSAMALNRDGSLLMTGSEDSKIRILDLSQDRQIAEMELEPKDWVNFFLVDEENGKLISAQGQGDISIWDISTGKKLKILKGHKDQVVWLLLLQQAQTLVSVADDETMKTWDCATGALLSTWSVMPGFVTANGDRLISLDSESGHEIQIWSIASQEKIRTLKYRSPAEKE